MTNPNPPYPPSVMAAAEEISRDIFDGFVENGLPTIKDTLAYRNAMVLPIARIIARHTRVTELRAALEEVVKVVPWCSESTAMEDFEWRCAFCGCEKPNHENDCSYEQARRVLDGETETK